MAFLNELRELLGRYALTTPDEIAPYVIDERRRYIGDAIAVALPADHQEVVNVLRLTEKYNIPVVPQSGNTSNVGGAVPIKIPELSFYLAKGCDESYRSTPLTIRSMHKPV